MRTFKPGTPLEDWHNREEIFTAWHDEHRLHCLICVVENDGRTTISACAEYHLIRLLYTALGKL
jgi:hypothetical protein